jgi:hypothetical protein
MSNAGTAQEVMPGFKGGAVKMVTESSRQSPRARARCEHVDEEPPLSISQRARLREPKKGCVS